MNTPLFPVDPLDAPTVAQQVGAATQTPVAQRPPGLRRRLAWLAATLYMPIILLGYALYLYGPTACVAGPVCALSDAPGIAQLLALALGFGALYFAGVRAFAPLLDEREPARSEVTRALRKAARYETIRPLLAIFAGVLALALLVGAIARTLNLPAFVIGGGMATLLFWLAAVGES